jgi:hypothetical protein
VEGGGLSSGGESSGEEGNAEKKKAARKIHVAPESFGLVEKGKPVPFGGSGRLFLISPTSAVRALPLISLAGLANPALRRLLRRSRATRVLAASAADVP